MEDLIRRDGVRHIPRKLLGQGTGSLVADLGGLLPQRQQHPLDAAAVALVEVGKVAGPGRPRGGRHGEGVATIERDEVLVDGEEIAVELLHLLDQLLLVVFGNKAEQPTGNDAGEEDVVLGKARGGQLPHEQTGIDVGGAEVAHGLEVAGHRHGQIVKVGNGPVGIDVLPEVGILAGIVQPADEVNLAAQNFGLRVDARYRLGGGGVEEQDLHPPALAIAGDDPVHIRPYRFDRVHLVELRSRAAAHCSQGHPTQRSTQQ